MDCILSLTFIDQDQGGLVTCSQDGKVKVWSRSLDLWGTLNQLDLEKVDKHWHYPRDAKLKQHAKELIKVRDLVTTLKDSVDSSANLLFNDKEPEVAAVTKKLKFASNARIKNLMSVRRAEDSEKQQINIAKMIDEYKEKLSNDSYH